MDPEVAELLAELDPCVYVIDSLPNMNAALILERVEPFVRTLRAAHPDTPIVLVEDPSFQNDYWVESVRQVNESNRAALRKGYQNLQASGVKGLFYVEGAQLLGTDGEATMDTCHPTDVGMNRIADVLEPVIRQVLSESMDGNNRTSKD